jgi:tripartite-type tricarboxylate transporter receptor subunit TctC
MRKILSFIVALATALTATAVRSQSDYPNRPVELVVVSSGSATDNGARAIADKLGEFLGQPVVVSVKPGAGGSIAASYVARAKPDGYTLMAVPGSPIIAVPFVQKNLPYNIDSFSYLSGYGVGTLYFMVKADSPYRNIADVVAAAKRKPRGVSYASYGVGVVAHFAAERLWDLAKVELNFVPYKSSSESIAAVLGGHVDLAVTGNTSNTDKNGQMRVIAVTGAKRHPGYPNIPTLIEQGFPVSSDFIAAIMGPKGIPDDVRNRLLDALKKADAKYSRVFAEQLMAGDMVYGLMPGELVLKDWRESQAWYREIAPKMKLD